MSPAVVAFTAEGVAMPRPFERTGRAGRSGLVVVGRGWLSGLRGDLSADLPPPPWAGTLSAAVAANKQKTRKAGTFSRFMRKPFVRWRPCRTARSQRARFLGVLLFLERFRCAAQPGYTMGRRSGSTARPVLAPSWHTGPTWRVRIEDTPARPRLHTSCAHRLPLMHGALHLTHWTKSGHACHTTSSRFILACGECATVNTRQTRHD